MPNNPGPIPKTSPHCTHSEIWNTSSRQHFRWEILKPIFVLHPGNICGLHCEERESFGTGGSGCALEVSIKRKSATQWWDGLILSPTILPPGGGTLADGLTASRLESGISFGKLARPWEWQIEPVFPKALRLRIATWEFLHINASLLVRALISYECRGKDHHTFEKKTSNRKSQHPINRWKRGDKGNETIFLSH